jgi:hypothetical protein
LASSLAVGVASFIGALIGARYSIAASWFVLTVFRDGGCTEVRSSALTIGKRLSANCVSGWLVITKQM